MLDKIERGLRIGAAIATIVTFVAKILSVLL